MANTLKVKRSATYSSTTNPTGLVYGEAAWNNGSSKLFVGKQTDGGGTVESFHVSSLADLSVGEGLDISLGSGNIDNAATLSAEDATSSNKGVASFHTDNFLVSSGAVTIKNGGVILGTETTGNYVATAVAGTGVSVSGATGNVTVTNTGVTSAVAGAGIDVSGGTGAVTVSIGTGEVVNAMIGDNEVNSEHYAAGSIDLEHMSANSIDSDQYVDGSIDTAHFATGSVDAAAMGANSVDSSELVDGSIDESHIANDAVTANKIVDDIALAGNCSTTGSFTVGTNLIVSGDTTTLNTSTLTVEDILITVAKNATNSATSDEAGIEVGGWSGCPKITYDDAGTQWELNKNTAITGTFAVSSTSTFTGALTASGGFANTTFDGGTY